MFKTGQKLICIVDNTWHQKNGKAPSTAGHPQKNDIVIAASQYIKDTRQYLYLENYPDDRVYSSVGFCLLSDSYGTQYNRPHPYFIKRKKTEIINS